MYMFSVCVCLSFSALHCELTLIYIDQLRCVICIECCAWYVSCTHKLWDVSSQVWQLENMPHLCGNSHAIWDHTMLPVSRQRWHCCLYHSQLKHTRVDACVGACGEYACYACRLVLRFVTSAYRPSCEWYTMPTLTFCKWSSPLPMSPGDTLALDVFTSQIFITASLSITTVHSPGSSVGQSVGWSVCLLVCKVYCGKTADLIWMSFGVMSGGVEGWAY